MYSDDENYRKLREYVYPIHHQLLPTLLPVEEDQETVTVEDPLLKYPSVATIW